MTSGRSYINWMKEAGRGHLAAVLSWGGYGLLLGGKLLQLQFDLLDTFFGMGNNMSLFLFCVGLGIGIGFLEFAYLLQGRKQDFYFSLPVRKSTIFYSRYLHGVFHGLVPMFCYMFVCGICQSSIDSLFMGYSAGYTFRSMLVYGMVFLLFYHIAIFVMCVCGQFVAAFCMLGLILYGFQFFLEQVWLVFMERLYETFYKSPVVEMLEKALVPWKLGYNLTGQNIYEKFLLLESRPEPMLLAAGVLWIVIFGALTQVVHKRRKAESVGHIFTVSMAARAAEFVLAVLTGTGICGLLLSVEGIGEMSPLLTVMVLAAAGMLAALFLHFIYRRLVYHTHHMRYTVQTFAKGKLLPVGECAAAAAIVCTLAGSAGRYDAYLPESNEVERVGIAMVGLDMDTETFRDMQNGLAGDETGYRMERFELSEDGKEAAMQWIRFLRKEQENSYTKVTVCFQKTNGSEVYRTYPVSEEMFLEFADVYETKEYRRAAYPMTAQDVEVAGGARFVWNDRISERILKLTEEEKKDFFELYKRDIETLEMTDLQTALPVGSLTVESEVYDRNISVLIYPFFEHCASFLEEHGVDVHKQVTDYPMQSVIVWGSRPVLPGQAGGRTMQRYETEEEIAIWKDRLIPQEFCIQPLLCPADTAAEIEAEVTDPESGAVVLVECYEKE